MFLLEKGGALVETVDVITPVVNHPYVFGEISAANSLSDIYAMGGRPFAALAVLGYSPCDYEPAVIKEILRGAVSVLGRAGACLAGGHSFEDSELKFGLSVSGLADKMRILRTTGAHAGDSLILTKPLGTGVLSTALKAGRLDDEAMAEAIGHMTTLNLAASEAALGASARAATDVTGFGLLGHALNMLRDSALTLEISVKNVPLMKRALEFVSSGFAPEGAYNNLKFVEGKTLFGDVSEDFRLLLSDPQTSGGLLVALPEDAVDAFRLSFGGPAAVIGRFVEGNGTIRLI